MRIGRVRLPGPDGWVERIVVAGRSPGEYVDVAASERLRLERRGASPSAARRIAAAIAPGSLTAALESGDAFLEAAREAAEDSSGDTALRARDARLTAPADPPSFRDFMAFAEHFETLYGHAGADPPAVLYELPVSYMGNAQSLLGPDAEIPWPAYSAHMDYELELAVVIGRPGIDLTPERALEHVLGVTILNDFSARDIQMREMAGRLGPSKGKHFATAIGPWIVTLDELALDRLDMIARVNGEVWSHGSSESITWPVADLVAWASAAEALPAGALLGTGTVGGGCGAELGRQLEPGDVVELEVEGIGLLRNALGHPGRAAFMPEPRRTTTVQEEV